MKASVHISIKDKKGKAEIIIGDKKGAKKFEKEVEEMLKQTKSKKGK